MSGTESPHLLLQIATVHATIKQTYDNIYPYLCRTYPAMFSPEVNTLSSLSWASVIVWSRAFDLGTEHDTRTRWGLVPVMDFVNHEPFIENSYFIDASSFDLYTSVKTLEGQEVMISYGPEKSSYSYLVYYGFLPESVHGDYISVTLVGTKARAHAGDGGQSLNNGDAGTHEHYYHGGESKELKWFVGPDGWVAKGFVDTLCSSIARMLEHGAVISGIPEHAGVLELEHARTGVARDAQLWSLALAWVALSIKDVSATFSTTLEEDVAWLERKMQRGSGVGDREREEEEEEEAEVDEGGALWAYFPVVQARARCVITSTQTRFIDPGVQCYLVVHG